MILGCITLCEDLYISKALFLYLCYLLLGEVFVVFGACLSGLSACMMLGVS